MKRFWRDARGATSIEYAMIASLIFVVIVTSVTTFGTKTGGIFTKVSNAISAAVP